MSQQYGPLWYLDPKSFNNPSQHQQQLQRLESEFLKSGETFAKEYLAKHPDIHTDFRSLVSVSQATGSRNLSGIAPSFNNSSIA